MNELVRVSSFGKKDKVLLIDGKTIRFRGKTIPKEEITGIIYGISAIQFYRFAVGNSYHIGLKTPAEQIHIILRSYLGIREDYFQDLFGRILEEIWEPVTDRIWNTSKDLLLSGETVQVGKAEVSKEGLLITQDKAFTSRQVWIGWEDLHYKKKNDRLVLNSKSDQQVWANLYFRDTWNIDILMTLLDWLTLEGGLAELQQ